MTSPRDMERGRAPLTAGEVLVGKYRIVRVLGQGGMGVVYAAHHILLDRPVALKLLRADAALQKDATARFLNEARNAARVDDEHVCRVMDLGVDESGQPFIAMELLEGVDLSRLLASRGPLPVGDAVGYVIQGLTGIGKAHVMGIIHRDLKPSNLFVAMKPGGGRIVKVLDFGISKAIGGAGRPNVTALSNTIGSPAYMSPEQVNLAPNIDARADLWAVGVILYELLTGRLPFASTNVPEVLAFILEKDPPPVSTLRPDVPPALDAVIARCLAKDPARRFADAQELARALAPFSPWAAAEAGVGAVPLIADPSTGTTAPVWTSSEDARPARASYVRLVAIGVGIGVALLAVVVVASWRGGEARVAAAASAASLSAIASASPPPQPAASTTTDAATAPTGATASAATTDAKAPEDASSAPKPSSVKRPGLSRQRR